MAEHDDGEGQRSLALTPTEKALSGALGVELSLLDDGRRVWKLSPQIAEKMNLLTPISSIVQVDSNWTPVPRAVSLRPGVDTFKVGYKDREEIHSIIGSALTGLADITGIETVSTRTVRFSGGMEVFVKARMRRPDGLFAQTERSADVYFDDHSEKVKLDALEKWEKYEKSKANGKPQPTDIDLRKLVLANKEFLGRTLQSKAFNRCVRTLLGIKAMPLSQFNKPFLGVAWYLTPQWGQPGTQRLVEIQHGGSLYGDADSVDAGGGDGRDPHELDMQVITHELDDGAGPVDVVASTGEIVDSEIADAVPVEDEELELDGEEPGEAEVIAEPERGFTIKASHEKFGGQHVRDVVQNGDGWIMIAGMCKRSENEAQVAMMLGWLSWAQQQELSVADL